MTTPIHQDARAGTLGQRQLLEWIRTGGHINSKDSNGLTPLCAAAMGGHSRTVQLLLKNGAEVNTASNHGCTPLWFTTRLEDPDRAYSVTDVLLRAGANVTSSSTREMLNTTPLMNAIRCGLGMKVLRLLLAKQTAKDIASAKKDAAFLKNKTVISALKDPSLVLAPVPSKSFFVRSVNALLGYLVAVVNKFTNNALARALGIRGSMNSGPGGTVHEQKVLSATKFDPVEFKKSVVEHLKATGLDKFFPAGSPFLEKVVKKASNLAKKGNTALARPEHLPGLTQLSLYKPILFCDNSGSMNTADRIDSIIEVARRITEIATHLIPDDEGVEIRFLNSDEKEHDLYKKYGKLRSGEKAAMMVAEADYDGITMLGTVLRDLILTPYVYEPLEKGPLERPLLISIITDGSPTGEDEDELDKAIIECKELLQSKGYDKRVVNFQISQIGDDPEADEFLERLQTDPKIKDHIFCTRGKLDEKFKNLGEKDDELEIWLFKTLMGPLLQA